ncbi:unnamed protein product [Orchesella dallaii]|uniref:Uncharacterized protein n=1 Tax=Orchesella dallaii TaxID=48710 RepID=A0ABP1R6A0_9HEXA
MSSPPNQVATPNPNTTLHNLEDNAYLQSLSPSTIFLHDGVLRSINLKSLKDFEQHSPYQDALKLSSINQMEELMSITSNNVDELSRKIIKLSTLHVQGIALHHRYQWHALKTAWKWRYSHAQEKIEKDKDPSSSILQSQSQSQSEGSESSDVTSTEPGGGAGGLGFKLSLCLLVPMLEAYAQQNSQVALTAMNLIFQELINVPVMSLNQENSCALEKLEDLLAQWSTKKNDDDGGASSSNPAFKISGPSAMVALACARGVISSFAKTVLMLENVENPSRVMLPVAPILRKLGDVRIKIGKPCALQNDKYLMTWPYDDRLVADSIAFHKEMGSTSHKLLEFAQVNVDSDLLQTTNGTTAATQNQPAADSPRVNRANANAPGSSASQSQDDVGKRFVATNGHFLFVTGENGKGIAKIGTGLRGTLQGWVYHNYVELNCGFLAYADGILISRPFELDANDQFIDGKAILGVTINTTTLKPDKLILMEPVAELAQPLITLGLTSDGSSVFFIRAELPNENSSGNPSGSQGPSQNQTNSESNERTGSSSSSPASSSTPSQPTINIWMDVLRIVEPSDSIHAQALPKTTKVPLVRQEEVNDSTNDKAGSSDGRVIRKTRSVRINNTTSPPHPPPLPPNTANQPTSGGGGLPHPLNYETLNTSLNLNLKQLQTALYFTCGNYLTIISSNNAQLFFPPPIGPPSSIASSTMRQYAPVLSSSCPKAIGTQIHLCMNGGSPLFSKQDFLNLSPDSSFFHGAVIPESGATYDPVNNLIWTVNGSFVDSWKNPGYIPPWKQNQILMTTANVEEDISSSPSSPNADVKTVINVMVRHMGIMANHFLLGDKDASIGFSGNVLKTLIELIFKYQRDFEGPELTSIFLTLQAIVSQLKGLEQESDLYKKLYDVQVMILCFLNDSVSHVKFT